MAKKRKKGALQQRAQRDVRLAFRPEMRAIDRAQDQARDDYEEADNRIKEIYDSLQANLAPLYGQYDAQSQQITQDLTGQLQQMSSMMGMTPAMTGAAAEGQAAAGAFTGIGAGGLSLLASERSRNLGYQTSTQRQGELERATLRKNYLEDFRDIVESLKEREIDVQGDKASAIIQRLDELRDQRYSRGMQERELDIAEQQFNKTFRLNKNESKASRDFARDQIDLVRTQAERKGDLKRIRPLRQDISSLRDEREEAVHGGSIGASLVPQLDRQIKRKRKRIKRIKRRDNPNY